jgi:hypothetical protein
MSPATDRMSSRELARPSSVSAHVCNEDGLTSVMTILVHPAETNARAIALPMPTDQLELINCGERLACATGACHESHARKVGHIDAAMVVLQRDISCMLH